ncbi:MAG TPA: hypothetical protein DCR40_12345 [Prolixibacteraceae bacterium]|nr:hypothetical protein [Prolixibacteraceae bacterium]
MKKISLSTYLLSISDSLFFILLLLYQLIFLFQGFDFADEGCHAAFYQQIFSHPETMVGNFMYWFSGIVGGSFFYIFPGLGLLGLRIQGLIVILSTMAIAYYLLKDYLNLLHLRIGILIIFIFTTNEIKEMHYDTLTALLNVSSAFFLFQGLRDNKSVKIGLSGAFISLSMFTRLPSIVMLVFVLAIIYYGVINKFKPSLIIKQGLILFGGFAIMTFLVILFMKLIGHLPVYVEALKMVFSWGSNAEDSHNIFRLIKLFIRNYSQAVKFGVLFTVFLIVLNYLDNSLSTLNKTYSRIIGIAIKLSIILVLIASLLKHHITYSTVISFFSGISLIIAVLILISTKYIKEVKLLVFIGCLILFFEPFGSAGGIATAGRHSLWIIFPFAIDFIFNVKTINGHVKISADNRDFLIGISSNHDQMNVFKRYFTGICIFVCVYFSYYYPYFDMSDRIYMTSTIECKNARGIFTTKERATVVNELLQESSKYIRKNDLVLAYDCIPMFHYLTETRPYMPNTWPWIYIPEAFKFELNKSKNKFKELPVIILQKVNTLASNWPQNYNIERKRSNPESMRDSILNDFMKNNVYIKVWENIAFEIRLPSGR